MRSTGAWLPPLSARKPSSFSRMGSDSKDMNASGGPQPEIGLVIFSLTKIGRKGIGRAPLTPNVTGTDIPSSLPSPLPTWKGTGSTSLTHARRSPLISMPCVVPSLKAVVMPVSDASYGRHDTVLSPVSIPVLPALLPLHRNGEVKENDEEKLPDQDANYEIKVKTLAFSGSGNLDTVLTKKRDKYLQRQLWEAAKTTRPFY